MNKGVKGMMDQQSEYQSDSPSAAYSALQGRKIKLRNDLTARAANSKMTMDQKLPPPQTKLKPKRFT
jgi:hypothetical protein